MPGCRKRKRLYKYRLPLRRRDLLTRMLVEVGISYAASLGGEKAREFLREKNVPEHVIVRVIGEDD
ncbi:MAG: hypothetical protein HY253_14455 [Burkholderiales bacterium]|nr:hypothetical protein [Burkholderiales bacterium]